MEGSTYKISSRKAVQVEEGSYKDRNDGYERTLFSRSKRNSARNTKQGKKARVKAPWKQ